MAGDLELERAEALPGRLDSLRSTIGAMTRSSTHTDSIRFEPWRRRGGDRLDVRRRELFALAAPVFRRHGFRGATIKELAHACHLSPASLYHYFPSKRALATYLVRRPRLDWDSTWVDPGIDPLAQLRQLVDLAIAELPNYLLALRLSEEAGDAPPARGDQARAFREGEAVFGRLIAAAAPGIPRERAARIARDLLAILAGTAYTGLDADPDRAVRERIVGLLRRELVPDIVDGHRFGEVFGIEWMGRAIRSPAEYGPADRHRTETAT